MSTWYHGTNQSSAHSICTKGIDFSKSNQELDFGVGFYLTDDEMVAEKRAIGKTKMINRVNRSNEMPAIVTVEIDDNIIDSLLIKEFPYCNEEWLFFTLANRLTEQYINKHNIKEHNLDLRYDIVKGSIADSDVSQIANHIETEDIDMSSVSVYDVLTDNGTTLGEQMSLHTKSSLKIVKKMSYHIIKRRNK